MKKVNKSILKEIVKECIIEIFEESFFAPGGMMSESKMRQTAQFEETSETRTRKSKRPVARQQRSSHLDSVTFNQESNVPVNENFDKKIETITSTLTDDPIMANIFKDTAATTLQEQIESGNRMSVMKGGDDIAKKVYNSDPTELFAESAGKWATLAFASKDRK